MARRTGTGEIVVDVLERLGLEWLVDERDMLDEERLGEFELKNEEVERVVREGVTNLEADETELDTSTNKVFVSIVRVPPRANKPPLLLAPPSAVTETCARIVPANAMLIPKVADVPTCQKTLQGKPPPESITAEPTEVTKVEPIWKYQASVGDPVPASIKVPVSCADELNSYVPGAKDRPPKLPVKTIPPLKAATTL
ncbi:hypothetical protein G7Y89_g14507 [Cudoniella acicularis]|uniref:Uncharacterized protein n=1 Tax=Cudoniella acicularis TaxID=354080 RepID=A0A8H4VT85_9HELO|nr:hypothetical protein G7Y89_g14507 [Cudoniella acicularis]